MKTLLGQGAAGRSRDLTSVDIGQDVRRIRVEPAESEVGSDNRTGRPTEDLDQAVVTSRDGGTATRASSADPRCAP